MPTVHAPEIDPDLEWLNTSRKLTLRELRGQIVVLDFWTYCCVNCMHVMPVLRRIEERFANESVVVVGVHSAKFDGEKDAARIAEAMRRYDVAHPVVVDRDMRTWSAFAVRSWPTLVVLRPDGTIAAVAPGEPDFDVLATFLDAELARARKSGTLATKPLAHAAPAALHTGPLAYPGKVAVGPSGAIAIADSGHHRVLVVDANGRVLHAIGSGIAGNADGAFDACAFDDPQGIAWNGATELFVADARAHTVVRIDLANGVVTTIAGTGELGGASLSGESIALATPLRSPWDLVVDGATVFVALAGSHQIAAIDRARGTIALVSGTGAESIVDGAFESATFSQPSGLCIVERKLYVADSETSAVRELDLRTRRVRTVVGMGLFVFGDRDGAKDVALMQHCIGIASDGRERGARVVVADTYNHKLCMVDCASGAVATFARGFAEPGGVSWDASREEWLVADTNAHRIVRVSSDGSAQALLVITGAPTPKRGRVEKARAASIARAERDATWFTTLLCAEGDAALAPRTPRAEIAFDLAAPEGKKIAGGSPIALAIEVSRRSDLIVLESADERIEAAGGVSQRVVLAASIESFEADAIDAEIVVRADLVVCDAGVDTSNARAIAIAGAVCEPYRAWLRLPVRLAKSGGARVVLTPAR